MSTVRTRRVHTPALTVSDPGAALRFYTEVLPFEPGERTTIDGAAYGALLGTAQRTTVEVIELKLGGERLQLLHFPNRTGRPIPADSRSNDGWFQHAAIVVTDMAAAYARIAPHVTEVSRGPQRLPASLPHAAGIEAIYFNDPDGHVLELIYFPEGKGDPRWQQPGLPLFAGIDHTAIGTDRTDEALGFYAALGLDIAGHGINYGPEQSRLNNVADARLLITTLRGEAGIGLELLDYLRPGSGRPYPADSAPWDSWHWHTHLHVDDVRGAYQRLREIKATFISPAVVDLSDLPTGPREGFLVRDPSGHALLVGHTAEAFDTSSSI